MRPAMRNHPAFRAPGLLSMTALILCASLAHPWSDRALSAGEDRKGDATGKSNPVGHEIRAPSTSSPSSPVTPPDMASVDREYAVNLRFTTPADATRVVSGVLKFESLDVNHVFYWPMLRT